MTFAPAPSQASEVLFKSSFYGAQDGTTYSDPMGFRERLNMKVDLKSNNALKQSAIAELKAITTDQGGAGSTDQTLVPLYLDNKIVDLSRIQTPMVAIMPRVMNRGITAEFNQITGKQFNNTNYSSASFYAESSIGDPGTGPASRDFTPSRQSVQIKYQRVVGQVTGPAQAAIPSFNIGGLNPNGDEFNASFGDQTASDAYSFDVLTAARSLKEAEENEVINGNTGTNANGFNGIVTTIGSNNNVTGPTATRLAADGGVSDLLDDINDAARQAYNDGGLPQIAICDPLTYVQIKQAIELRTTIYNFEEESEYGFTYLKFRTIAGELKIMASRFLTETQGSRGIYLLDMSVWEMRVLLDMTMERLAKVDDHERFHIKQYLTLICRAPQFNGAVVSIGA